MILGKIQNLLHSEETGLDIKWTNQILVINLDLDTMIMFNFLVNKVSLFLSLKEDILIIQLKTHKWDQASMILKISTLEDKQNHTLYQKNKEVIHKGQTQERILDQGIIITLNLLKTSPIHSLN